MLKSISNSYKSRFSFLAAQTSIREFSSTIVPKGLKVVSSNLSHVNLQLDSQDPVSFTTFFLRDSCTSPGSIHSSSKQKLFTTAEILANPDKTTPSLVQVIQDEQSKKEVLEIIWKDDHRSIFNSDFLTHYSDLSNRRQNRLTNIPKIAWDKSLYEKNVSEVSYNDYMNSDETLFKFLDDLHYYGLGFIKGVPESPPATGGIEPPAPVEIIAERIGYIKQTFYGKIFDVKSIPNAKNVAYTSVFLPLHMDLCYYESPPGLQYLHSLQNDATGGDSIYADSYYAAEQVLKNDPEAYEALLKIPQTFHYDNDGFHYYYQRPLIVEDPYSDINPITGRKLIREINYSPPFQGPFESNIIVNAKDEDLKTYKDFIRGYELFEKFVNAPESQYQTRLEAGTCVVFMNRRTLHSRLEFDSKSGGRWFQGTYSDIDTFQSKLRVLSPKNLN